MFCILLGGSEQQRGKVSREKGELAREKGSLAGIVNRKDSEQ